MARESVIVQSKLREAVKQLGLQMDGSLPDAVNDKVHAVLAEAADRAKANGRKTLRPHDL